MSYQRRHGQAVQIWSRKLTEDKRGNETLAVDMTAAPWTGRAAGIPQRSSKAEMPGQQQIDVVRLILPPNLPEDCGLWARVKYLDDFWDVAAPPAYHHGSRRTRHWSMEIRRRP